MKLRTNGIQLYTWSPFCGCKFAWPAFRVSCCLRSPVLDVYCCGHIPQVEVTDHSFMLCEGSRHDMMAMVARGVWNDIVVYKYNESLFSYMKAMFLLLQFPTCRLRYVFTLWFSAFKHGYQNCLLYLDPTERVSHASGGLPLPQHFFRPWAKGRSFPWFTDL